MSAAKVMRSVLKVLWFRTRTTLIMRGDKASDKRLMIANVAIFPMLAAKFLPLKMLTVLSFLIFPYFHSLYRCSEKQWFTRMPRVFSEAAVCEVVSG